MNDKMVYYYCDTSTACKILNNHEIWMTSIRNLNDSNEAIGVYKVVFDLLEKHDYKKLCLQDLIKFSRQPGIIQMYETPLGSYAEYVACFSKNPDSVSQWVSYADGGRGLAIGFDESAFQDISLTKNLRYQGISYVCEDDVQQHIPSLYDYLVKNKQDDNLAMMDMAMERINQIYKSGLNYKTMHYVSEREKRIIYIYPEEIAELPKGWAIGKMGVYPKRNMLNTYVPLTFPAEIVKEVITGPKYEKNYFEVEVAMEALGYTGIEIHHSKSGYR